MGASCSKESHAQTGGVIGGAAGNKKSDVLDPFMHDLMQRSCALQLQAQLHHPQNYSCVNNVGGALVVVQQQQQQTGQHHLLYKHQNRKAAAAAAAASTTTNSASAATTTTTTAARPSTSSNRQYQQQRALYQEGAANAANLATIGASGDPRYTGGTGNYGRSTSASSSSRTHHHHHSHHSSSSSSSHSNSSGKNGHIPTRLVVRRRTPKSSEEGMSGTHIFAIRFPANLYLKREIPTTTAVQEQHPSHNGGGLVGTSSSSKPTSKEVKSKLPSPYVGPPAIGEDDVCHLFDPSVMAAPPLKRVSDWVTVSDEHGIYIADVGLSNAHCDALVQVTEHVCRGNYAAYTYAKQTLGCREFPALAQACQSAVHTITYAILEFSKNDKLLLDDREPHMVKYDVTKKERQKLDMHTDKSEWTFLISLSNGCGLDYEGGGTYFECLDATIHLQRGHALLFPGKLRHCGQRITSGLRFLLVGFLVDKTSSGKTAAQTALAAAAATADKQAAAAAATVTATYSSSFPQAANFP